MIGRVLLTAGLLGLATGCAGARADVTANQARYPLSMSSQVRDKDGTVHGRGTLEKVGELESSATPVGILYSLLTFPSTVDISDDVNQQVKAAGGEAVVRLQVTASGGCDILNGFPVLNLLPIWPGCIPLTVTGDIVRRKAPPAAPAASATVTSPATAPTAPPAAASTAPPVAAPTAPGAVSPPPAGADAPPPAGTGAHTPPAPSGGSNSGTGQ